MFVLIGMTLLAVCKFTPTEREKQIFFALEKMCLTDSGMLGKWAELPGCGGFEGAEGRMMK